MLPAIATPSVGRRSIMSQSRTPAAVQILADVERHLDASPASSARDRHHAVIVVPRGVPPDAGALAP